jgi:hypothetical protein
MKKLMISVSLILAVSSANYLKAQTEIGIKGGVNFSSVTDLNGKDRVSGHGGIFLHSELNRHWCIQPELLYSAQGEKSFTENGVKNDLNLNYLQLPVMFQYFATKSFYIEAGPQVGYLLQANRESSEENKASVKDNYKKVDVGINAGVGVWATRNIGFYGRYNLGLMDVSKLDGVDRKNRNIELGAAIRFGK